MKSVLRYVLLSLPLFLLTNCQDITGNVILMKETQLTKDSEVVSLMLKAVQSDTNQIFSKSDDNDSDVDDDQCTNILYPINFDVFFGDDPNPTPVVINSDDELIEFLSTLTGNTGFYIYFPISLVDTDGNETIIYDLTEFEGTLQMLVDACQGSGDDNDNGNDENDYDYCQNNNKKVYICHKGHTICVSINAIWGHLAHHEEDYLGQCE